MKRISFLLIALSLCAAPSLRAQDARTEERLNKLSGQIEDLIAGQEAQKKRVSEVMREMESLREQIGKPNNSYASQEDLKRLAKTVEEVDRKRIEDGKKVDATLANLAKQLTTGTSNSKDHHTPSSTEKKSTEKAPPPEKGFEYTIKSGDTLSAIIAAYKDQNIKITDKDILKANPGLVPEKMKVGQKIFIPAPQKEKAAD